MQTEYARLPHPRITTSISAKGQVLHKIEKQIDTDVTTIEEMHEVEDYIKSQHLEVSRIIRDHGLPQHQVQRTETTLARTRFEQIQSLEEVERVFFISEKGEIVGQHETTPAFKRAFKHVLKELPQMLRIFADVSGPKSSNGAEYEDGIYEIEPGKLILVSTGIEFYLVIVKSGADYLKIMEGLKRILFLQH